MGYENGKIYMVYPLIDNINKEDIYIGSTKDKLYNRIAKHRYEYRNKNRNKTKRCIDDLFDKYGLENCKIELIYNFPCNSKNELNREEGTYIRNNKCINKQIAGRTQKEWYEDNKERILEQRKKTYLERIIHRPYP